MTLLECMREQTVPSSLVAGSQVSLQLPFLRVRGRGSWKKFFRWGTRLIPKVGLAHGSLEAFPVSGWFSSQLKDREPGPSVSHLQGWHLQGRVWLRAWGLLYVVYSFSDCSPGSGLCRSSEDIQIGGQPVDCHPGLARVGLGEWPCYSLTH